MTRTNGRVSVEAKGHQGRPGDRFLGRNPAKGSPREAEDPPGGTKGGVEGREEGQEAVYWAKNQREGLCRGQGPSREDKRAFIVMETDRRASKGGRGSARPVRVTGTKERSPGGGQGTTPRASMALRDPERPRGPPGPRPAPPQRPSRLLSRAMTASSNLIMSVVPLCQWAVTLAGKPLAPSTASSRPAAKAAQLRVLFSRGTEM